MAAIVSVAAALPATCVTNDDLAQTLDTSDAWIASRTGIRQRFVLGADESFLELCVDAAARAGGAGGGVDFVVVATTTPASDFGDAAAVGARRGPGLAAPGCGGLDVRSACCGFVDALGVARALVGGGAATRFVFHQANARILEEVAAALGLRRDQCPCHHGMLFHHLSDPGGRHFVEVFRFDVAETVRVDDWRRAWREVVAPRRVASTFDFGGDAAPTMTVHDAVDADAVFLEDDTEEALAAAGAAGVAAALDGGARRSRAGLAGGRCVVAIHHLVTDGASTKLLLEDIAAAYAGAPPPKVDAWAAGRGHLDVRGRAAVRGAAGGPRASTLSLRCLRSGGAYVLTVVSEGAAAPGPLLGAFARVLEAVAASAARTRPSRSLAARARARDDDDDDDDDDEEDEEDAAAVDDASPAAATPTEAALRAADADAGARAVDLDVLGGAGVIAHARGPFPLLRSARAGDYDVYPLFGVGAAHFVGLHASSVTGSPVSPQIYWEWDFPGGLDVDAFASAWDALVARHGTLRAHVGADGAMRSWRDAATFAGRVAVRVGAARGAFREDFRGAGDAIGSVHEWPLFAVGASFDGGRATAHVAMSLFLMDAVSDLTFRAELSGAYECLRKGGAVVFPTPAPALAFGDYSRSLVAGLPESRAYLLAKRHWAKKLEDPAFPRRGPAIPRRADVEAHTPASPAFVNQTSTVSGAAWADCRAACRARGVTAPVALLATYCLALCRHVEDASANGRRFLLNVLLCLRYDVDEDAFRCLGNCSSTVLVDVDLRKARTFGEACGALRASLAESLEHSAMSGVEVMALLNRERASTFEAAAPFVFTTPVGVEKSLPRAEDAARDWCFEETFFSERVPHTACVNAVKDAPGAPAGDEPALFCSLDVVDGAFPGAVAAELKRSYAFLLREALCGDWDADVWAAADAALSGAYPVAAPPYAATPEPPAGTLLQDALERRVGDTEQTALFCVEDDEARPLRRFSFAEVLSRSRACASLLRGLGLAPGFLGAVVMAKGWRQVVAVHAILFEAGAYVPCDAALWPAGRVRAVVSRSGAAVCLVDGAAPADLGGAPAVTVTDFERDEPETAWPPRGAARAAPARAKPEDAAYVIYTSGSTGLPKGVVCHHRGALNTIEDLRARWGLGDRDVLLGLASLAFDLSVFDVFGGALCGAALALPRAADLSPPDPDAWLRLCDRAGVTVWNSVPALLDLAVSGLELRDGTLPRALRVAFLSGDVVPAGLPARAYDRSPTVRVVLMGGATEAAIWSNEFPVERPGRLPAGWGGWPYGRPMSNQTMSILSDATLEPLPPYVVGVIHIGGVGVMTGYRGDDEKNRRSLRTRARDGRRFFRTGDLGRMRLCGGDWVLEILGREDGQAKVRGFRVELGEIEAAISSHPKVRAAACAVVDGGGAIEAHVVLRTAGALDAKLEAALRATLAKSLPTYAVPRAFGAVAALPLSPNGKVDRSRLPPLRRRAASPRPTRPHRRSRRRRRSSARPSPRSPPPRVDAAAICAATGHFFRVLGAPRDAARSIAARARRGRRGLRAGPAATYEALPLGDGSAGKPTLVLLNPAGATALCYGPSRGASRWALTRRVVGLDDGVVAGREPALAHASIAEAARAAAAATKRLAGDAPLVLGGWSYGGVVAVEAARLLGDAVAGVALFDAPVAGAVVSSADLGDASPAAAAHFAAATELLVSYYGSDRAPLDLPALDALPADSEDPRRGDRASLLPRRTAARVPGSHWTMLADDAALDAVVDAVARWVAGL
ncbi:acyl carrier protein [Aureococcus anophagefferens]|uniref:Acyl carrier protein n=1 Tax=Aureococcus anophagefferens TaxID=44056 RepID=A0ABR1FQR9_AURAN